VQWIRSSNRPVWRVGSNLEKRGSRHDPLPEPGGGCRAPFASTVASATPSTTGGKLAQDGWMDCVIDVDLILAPARCSISGPSYAERYRKWTSLMVGIGQLHGECCALQASAASKPPPQGRSDQVWLSLFHLKTILLKFVCARIILEREYFTTSAVFLGML